MPIQHCWALAQQWYADRLDRDWQRPGQAELQKLFDNLGLVGKFWDLGGTN
jgi:hypothetical protein